jgi:hypothetical protein
VKFFIWEPDWDCTEDFRDCDRPDNLIAGDFLLGKTLDAPSPPFRFHVRRFGNLNDSLLSRWGWLVFSRPLQEVIQHHTRDPIQFLEVQLIKSGNLIEDHGYRLCNPLTVIPAVDRARSEWVLSQPRQAVVGIRSLVLDEDAVGEHSFFRLREFRPALVVREDLARAVLEAGFSGMTFTPPEDYQR